MAKADAERYKKGMETYYKEELALMCSGNTTVSSPVEEDKKPSAEKEQQLLAPTSNPSANPAAPHASPAQARHNQVNSMTVEELVQFHSMLQLGTAGNINKEELIKEISLERSVIKQRLAALVQESEVLRMKDRVLGQLLSSSLSGIQNTTSANSGLSSLLGHEFQHLSRSAFPQISQAQFLSGNPLDMMALGHAGNIDDALLLNQFMASQQLQHQLAGGGIPAAASFANQRAAASQVATTGQPTPSPNTGSESKATALSGQMSNQSNDSSLLNQLFARPPIGMSAAPTAPTRDHTGFASLMPSSYGQINQSQHTSLNNALLNQYLVSQQLAAGGSVRASSANQHSFKDENSDH